MATWTERPDSVSALMRLKKTRPVSIMGCDSSQALSKADTRPVDPKLCKKALLAGVIIIKPPTLVGAKLHSLVWAFTMVPVLKSSSHVQVFVGCVSEFQGMRFLGSGQVRADPPESTVIIQQQAHRNRTRKQKVVRDSCIEKWAACMLAWSRSPSVSNKFFPTYNLISLSRFMECTIVSVLVMCVSKLCGGMWGSYRKSIIIQWQW